MKINTNLQPQLLIILLLLVTTIYSLHPTLEEILPIVPATYDATHPNSVCTFDATDLLVCIADPLIGGGDRNFQIFRCQDFNCLNYTDQEVGLGTKNIKEAIATKEVVFYGNNPIIMYSKAGKSRFRFNYCDDPLCNSVQDTNYGIPPNSRPVFLRGDSRAGTLTPTFFAYSINNNLIYTHNIICAANPTCQSGVVFSNDYMTYNSAPGYLFGDVSLSPLNSTQALYHYVDPAAPENDVVEIYANNDEPVVTITNPSHHYLPSSAVDFNNLFWYIDSEPTNGTIYATQCLTLDCASTSSFEIFVGEIPHFPQVMFYQSSPNIPIYTFMNDSGVLKGVFCDDLPCSTFTIINFAYTSSSYPTEARPSVNFTRIVYNGATDLPQTINISPNPVQCQAGHYLSLSSVPSSCISCGVPPGGKLYNPYPNHLNMTCIQFDLPACVPGQAINASTFLCEPCPISPNVTGGYNVFGLVFGQEYSCIFQQQPDCTPGQYSNITGPLSECMDCTYANTSGAFNRQPGRFENCTWETPLTNCSFHQKMVLAGVQATCTDCPDASTTQWYNPYNSIVLSCVVFDYPPCDSNTYLVLDGPSKSCEACPAVQEGSLGSFNPDPNRELSCSFILDGTACASHQKQLVDKDGNPFCQTPPPPKTLSTSEVLSLLGGLGAGVAFLGFFGYRWRQAAHKSHVEYRDVSFSPNTASISLKSAAIPSDGAPFVNVLSLDGGGMRGLSIVDTLDAIQEGLGIDDIVSIFHLIGGTSTGGLLALGLSTPHRDLITARQLYSNLGIKVFKASHRLPLVRLYKNIVGKSLYSGQDFESLLQDIFGEEPLFPNLARFPYAFGVATITSVHPPEEFLFRTYRLPSEYLSSDEENGSGSTGSTGKKSYLSASIDEDWTLWEAARATSAAPIFFPEFSRPSYETGLVADTRLWADGALYHNNPARVVLSEAISLWGPSVRFSVFLSLGTGKIATTTSSSTSKSSFSWAKTLASIVTNSERAHHEIEQTIPPEAYYRFNPPLPSHISLDSATSRDIQSLNMITTAYLNQAAQYKRITELVQRFLVTGKFLSPEIPAATNAFSAIQIHKPTTSSSPSVVSLTPRGGKSFLKFTPHNAMPMDYDDEPQLTASSSAAPEFSSEDENSRLISKIESTKSEYSRMQREMDAIRTENNNLRALAQRLKSMTNG